MKKIVQLLFCALAVSSVNAQTLFSADFEDGTLGEMTMVDGDMLTPAANVAGYVDAWNVVGPDDINAGLESNVAMSNSWYTPAGTADDWLITPQLTIEDGNTAFTFEARAIDPNYPDGYEIRVSTTDNSIASFTDVIFSSAAEVADGTMQKRSASLTDYVGQSVYVAIRNNSTDKFLLAVDNIAVKVIQARDVQVNSFTSARYHIKDTDIPVSINIQNEGAELLTMVDLNWSDGTNEYNETITGLSLATGEAGVITSSSSFVATEAVSYGLSVWTSMPNGDTDLNDTNNQIDAVVAGVSYLPKKVVVGEEGTGTWCGWCPRGAVALEYMEENFSDEFVGIAVHNGDPMVVTEYDSGLGITGFPGGKMDRLVDIDPGLFEDGHIILRNIVSPIAPSVSALADLDNRTITVTSETEFVTQLDSIDFRLAAVITEDGVTGTGSGYIQENYYSSASQNIDLIDINGVNYRDLPASIPAADMVYDHVARAILGGFDGAENSVPANVVDGDIVSFDFTWEVPAAYNMEKMHVALLVIDNASGAILNAAKGKVELPVSTKELIDETIAHVYPNPASDLAIIDINLSESAPVTLQVVDMMGKVITKADLGTLSGKNQKGYDVSQLNAGMYLFKITAGELSTTKKIMVVK